MVGLIKSHSFLIAFCRHFSSRLGAMVLLFGMFYGHFKNINVLIFHRQHFR